jgi:predicted transcriptional regulator
MRVPPDLTSRLSSVAMSSGRSPESLLREAIIRMIDGTVAMVPTLEDTPQQTEFVPQPQSFSVYE